MEAREDSYNEIPVIYNKVNTKRIVIISGLILTVLFIVGIILLYIYKDEIYLYNIERNLEDTVFSNEYGQRLTFNNGKVEIFDGYNIEILDYVIQPYALYIDRRLEIKCEGHDYVLYNKYSKGVDGMKENANLFEIFNINIRIIQEQWTHKKYYRTDL